MGGKLPEKVKMVEIACTTFSPLSLQVPHPLLNLRFLLAISLVHIQEDPLRDRKFSGLLKAPSLPHVLFNIVYSFLVLL